MSVGSEMGNGAQRFLVHVFKKLKESETRKGTLQIFQMV